SLREGGGASHPASAARGDSGGAGVLTTLADRIRGIVKPVASTNALPFLPVEPHLTNPPDPSREVPVLERILGGSWRDGCFVVEHRRAASSRHGKEAVGQLASRLDQTAD